MAATRGPIPVRCQADCFNLCLTRQTDKFQWSKRGVGKEKERDPDPVAPLKLLALESASLLADEGEKEFWHPGPPIRIFTAGWSNLEEFEVIMQRLNASRIDRILINPSARALESLFDRLAVPQLRVLDFTGPYLPCEVVPALVDFLRSPRSHGLEYLIVPTANRSPLAHFSAIIQALTEGNVTLKVVCDRSCGFEDYPPVNCTCAHRRFKKQEHCMVARQTRAFNEVLDRNKHLAERVRRGALSSLVTARILYHARPADSGPCPIMDLPSEVLQNIAWFASHDPEPTLSESQFFKINKHASDRDTLAPMARIFTEAASEGPGKLASARDEWLANGGFWWEGGAPK